MSGRRRAVVIAAGTLFGLSAAAAVAVQVVFDAYRIPSSAMAPTLKPGDRVLARSIDGSEARRRDIIIFHPPAPAAVGSQASTRISRVVAVGGDHVEGSPTTVPRGSVYVVGDNRGNSQDSRFYGPVAGRDVVARVSVQNLPLDWITIGAALVLGVLFALVFVGALLRDPARA